MRVKVFFGKFVSRYLLLHLLGMVLFIAALCLGVKYGLNIYTHHGENVEVPDVTGMDFKQALALLDNKDLLITVVDTGHNKKLPNQCILNQTPTGGSSVKKSHCVYVTINSHTMPSIKIPDLINNCSYREAQARLTSLGFKMQEPIKRDGEPKDWVVGIKYRGREIETGEMIPIESELALIIGNGAGDDENEYDMMLDAPDSDNGDEVDEFEEVTAPEL